MLEGKARIYQDNPAVTRGIAGFYAGKTTAKSDSDKLPALHQ
jgi:hypothetical protein